MSRGRCFDLHEIDRDAYPEPTVTFRRFDNDRGREVLVVVTVSQWEAWDRPVTITADIAPGPTVIAPRPADLAAQAQWLAAT